MTINDLHSLVHQFNAQEHTLIRYALKGASENKEENKSIQLFDYLAAGKKVSRVEASEHIYKSKPDTRINKLVSRLWEKVLDAITTESFLRKNERLSEQAILKIESRKKALQCTLLLNLNGSTTVFSKLLAEGINYAIKSEAHYVLVDLLKAKNDTAYFHLDSKEYDLCLQQMLYYKKSLDVAERLSHCYVELTKEQGFGNANSPEEKKNYIKSVLREFNKERVFVSTVYAKFMLCMIEVEYACLEENYLLAKKTLLHLYKEIRHSFMIDSFRIARIEIELCQYELFLGNYIKAIKYGEKAISVLLLKNKTNYYVSLDIIFFPVFYTAQFDYAEEIISKMLSDESRTRNEFRTSKPHYYQACVYFQKKEFKNSLAIVNKPMPLNKDKTGFDIAIRILRIQNLVALERLDEASMQIENLRKHISRNSKESYTSERDLLIVRVLVEMQKRSFSGRILKTEAELLKKLSLNTGPLKWMPKTPELIKFHEWHHETFSKNVTL